MGNLSEKKLERIVAVFQEVRDELSDALFKFPDMCSPHEGYAIIKEEVDELWEEVKRNPYSSNSNVAIGYPPPDVLHKTRMKVEATQIAAMAIRFILNVCDKE